MKKYLYSIYKDANIHVCICTVISIHIKNSNVDRYIKVLTNYEIKYSIIILSGMYIQKIYN